MEKKKERVIQFLRKHWKIILVVILIITASNLWEEKRNMQFSLINYKSIPHINLTNTLAYYPHDNSFAGEIRGFVKLKNENDQPKNMRQYFTIETTNNKDVLVLDEIVALNALPPQSIGKTKLVKKSESGETMVLEDENGLQFFYNKNSKEISLEDAKLITSDSNYRDFMLQFINK
ncbi:MAG: hypothetical protein M0P97_00260 [Candidatus Moranbacteria bacterium]|jgi:hypothetical protein|nr:hypothetical protein [Candidatus Moranbacteria bacterium]